MYLKKGNQVFNVGLIRYASSEDEQGSVFCLGYLKSGRFLMVQETFTSAEGASFWGVWEYASPPPSESFQIQKAFKKTPFPALSGR